MSNCDIRRSGGLESFNTTDANTDVGGLNHRHIIGTIADGQEKSLLVTLDKFDNQSLLKRRNTTEKILESGEIASQTETYQQTTALHITARSKNSFSISFSKAKVRDRPSIIKARGSASPEES